jgi:hypothetical protein
MNRFFNHIFNHPLLALAVIGLIIVALYYRKKGV